MAAMTTNTTKTTKITTKIDQIDQIVLDSASVDRAAELTAVDEAAASVLAALHRVANTSQDIQSGMTALVTALSYLTKAEILASTSLKDVLGHSMTGLDRKALIVWIERWTPIRVHLSKNGRLSGVGWSSAYVKAARAAGVEPWRLAEAALESWYGCLKEVPVLVAKAPETSRTVDAAVKSTARRGVQVGSMELAKKEFLATISSEFDARMTKYTQSKGFLDWKEKYQSQK
jgi:hypothetical protein